jgi:hypothetical protein
MSLFSKVQGDCFGDIMSEGKLAEFFNSKEPWKVTKYNNDNSFLNKTM